VALINPHKADKIPKNTISLCNNLDPPCIEVKQPLTITNITVRRTIATKKCTVNAFFLQIIAGVAYNQLREILTVNRRGVQKRRLPSPKRSAKLLGVGSIRKTNRL
jgi:hypothetical protein